MGERSIFKRKLTNHTFYFINVRIPLIIWCPSPFYSHFKILMNTILFYSQKNLLFVCSYPPCRDLMDRLVDEAEGLVVDGSASVCSSSSGGRMEYSAEHQLNLLNSITASDLSGE